MTATQTKAEKLADLARGVDILNVHAEEIRSGNALVLISTEYGKGVTDYLRASVVYTDKDGTTQRSHLTWAIAKALGYSLRDRNGYWFISISGGGYSKADEIARSLANFYGIDRVRYEQN